MAGPLSSRQQMILFVLIGLLFLLPVLPNAVLMTTDHIAVRVILLSALAVSAYGGPHILLVTFLIVMSLFMLRNQAKMRTLSAMRPIEVPAVVETPQNLVAQPVTQESFFEGQAEEVETMVTPGEEVLVNPAFENPNTDDEYTWTPGAEVGTNRFTPVAPSINEKIVLETEASDGQGGQLFDSLKRYVDNTQQELMQ